GQDAERGGPEHDPAPDEVFAVVANRARDRRRQYRWQRRSDGLEGGSTEHPDRGRRDDRAADPEHARQHARHHADRDRQRELTHGGHDFSALGGYAAGPLGPRSLKAANRVSRLERSLTVRRLPGHWNSPSTDDGRRVACTA